jgi:hypothetical protein
MSWCAGSWSTSQVDVRRRGVEAGSGEGEIVRRPHQMLMVLGLVGGIGFVAPAALSLVAGHGATAVRGVLVGDAAAQSITNPGILDGNANAGSGGRSRATGGNGDNGGSGGRGGHGGLSAVNDVGTAEADSLNVVIIHDVVTGDVDGHAIHVDARGATRPVVVSVAGSFGNTGVDVFAPGGSPQAGTTGGNGVGADSSGGNGGEGGDGGNGGNGGNPNARGGDGGQVSAPNLTAPIG